MNRTSKFAFPLALPLALTFIAAAVSAQPVAAGRSQHAGASAVKAVPADVLWFQNDQDSGIAIVSQNFEGTFDAYDAMAADDFVVPEGEAWVVRQVQVSGVYFNGAGPATSENVVFYSDLGKGSPGQPIKAYPAVVGAPDGTGTFVITLPEALPLEAGKYWVGIQANLDFAVGGEWGWETRVPATGTKSAWKNRGGGFGTGCVHYKHMRGCLGDTGQGLDFMFSILGDRQSQ